jgi:hypothetical protein
MASFRLATMSAAVAAITLAAPAFAHHSAAMFDQAKTVTITGAVKTFRWANPHAMIEVVSMGDKGAQMVWNIECSTPNILVRKGWSINSFKPGDMITVQGHPMRDGGQAALMMNVTTSGGAKLMDHDY